MRWFLAVLLGLVSGLGFAQFKVDLTKTPIVQEKRRALIIGASNYEHLGKLTYASNDAKRFRDALKEGFRFEDSSIQFLSDAEDSAVKPTSANVLKSLDSLLADPTMDKGDLFILYFSGHGMGTPRGDYLCATDSTVADVEKTGLPISQVIDKLVAAKLRNVVIIADACRAGEKNEFGLQLAELAKKSNLAVMLGCEPGKKSYESPILKSGVFTYFLLKALSNPKYRTESGGLWTSRVAQNMSGTVKEFTERDHGDNAQVPVGFADPTSDVMLAKFIDGDPANLAKTDADQKMVIDPKKIADQLVEASASLFDKNDFEKILELNKQALSLDSSNMFAAYYASIACTFLGRSGEHEKLCDQMKSSTNPYFRNLGYIQSDSRATPMIDRTSALNDFWESSPKDELHSIIVWTRSRTYLSMEMTRVFIQKMLPALKEGTRVKSFFAGEVASANGQVDEALKAYDAALKTPDPGDRISDDILAVLKMSLLFEEGRHADLKAFLKTQFDRDKVSPMIWTTAAVFLKGMGNRDAAIGIVKKGIKESQLTEDQAVLAAMAMGASIGEIADDLEALVKAQPFGWKIRTIAAIARGVKIQDAKVTQAAFTEASKYCDDELQIVSLTYRINDAIYQDATKNLGIPADKFSDAYDIFRILYFNFADRIGTDFEKWSDLGHLGISTLQGPATLRVFKTFLKDFNASAELGGDFYGMLFQLAVSVEDDKVVEFAVNNPRLRGTEKADYMALYTAYLISRKNYDAAQSVFKNLGSVSEANQIVVKALAAVFKARAGDKTDLLAFVKQPFSEVEGSLIAEGVAALVLSDLGNDTEALPHLEHLTRYHPTMLDSLPIRCTERYLRILRGSGKNSEADAALYEVIKVNQTSPGIFNSHFGAKPSIDNFATKIKADTHWISDEIYDESNPTHKSQYVMCAIGDGHLELTFARDGTVTGFAQIIDGEKLVLSGTVDQFGNLRGKAKGPKLQFDVQAKLVSNEFRQTEIFKKSSIGQMIEFFNEKGLVTHWMLPASVLTPAGG